MGNDDAFIHIWQILFLNFMVMEDWYWYPDIIEVSRWWAILWTIKGLHRLSNNYCILNAFQLFFNTAFTKKTFILLLLSINSNELCFFLQLEGLIHYLFYFVLLPPLPLKSLNTVFSMETGKWLPWNFPTKI